MISRKKNYNKPEKSKIIGKNEIIILITIAVNKKRNKIDRRPDMIWRTVNDRRWTIEVYEISTVNKVRTEMSDGCGWLRPSDGTTMNRMWRWRSAPTQKASHTPEKKNRQPKADSEVRHVTGSDRGQRPEVVTPGGGGAFVVYRLLGNGGHVGFVFLSVYLVGSVQ